MRDYTKSEFKKRAGITQKHHEDIIRIKGKKSIAGKLKEIIQSYLDKHKLNGN